MGCLRLALLALLALLGPAAPATADVVDDRPAAVSRSAGDVVVLARGADGTMLVRFGIDAPWRSLGGSFTSGPAASVRASGVIDVFARGADGASMMHATISGEAAGPWESLGGSASSGPGAVQRFGGPEVDLFYAAPDRSLQHRFFTPADGWSGEERLGGEVFAAPGPVSRQGNWLDVYVRGASDTISNKSYPNAPWREYSPLPETTSAAPSAVSRREGDIDLYTRAPGGALAQRHFFGDGRGYRDPSVVDPRPLGSAPAATIDGPTRVHVFARDGADLLVKSFEDGKGYAEWRSLGPVAVLVAPQPPAPPPAPIGGGQVSFEAGLSCTPRGGRLKVSVDVRKRGDRRKPRVTRVVFFYRQGKRGRVARTDRKAPYRRSLPVALLPGTYRVYARIEYTRGRKQGRKTVSRRFAVCG